jgi:hypothetical protein
VSSGMLWFGLGIALGLILVLAIRFVLLRSRSGSDDRGPVLEDDGTRPPLTPLQKRAWIGLAIGGVTVAALASVFADRGAESFYQDRTTRLLVSGIILAGIVGYSAVLLPLKAAAARRRETPVLDERDRAILSRAPAVQATAIKLSLAAWAVGLTEVYWEAGSIPIAYPYLIFMTTLVVSLTALSLGILLGYRRDAFDA